MMKHVKLILLAALCLALAACGPKGAASDGSDASVSGSDVSGSASSAQLPEFPEAEPLPPLTSEDKDHAQDAAYDYYMGTVFEVHSLTEADTKEGEITFQVSCSKDGVKQDPDRFISLERKNGTWSVVNEGY